MQKSFLKGVTPALAVILLSAVTVGVVSTAFYGISSLTEKTQNETSGLIEHEFDVMGAKLKIDVFGDCKIYLANTGTKDIPIEVIGFYVAEPGTETYKPVTTSPTTGTIKKDAVQEINFTGLSTGKHKLIVKIYGNRMDYGYLTCTGPSIACYDDSNCDDGDPCTTDTCNDAGTSTSSCSHTQITNCIDNDGCCPDGCVADPSSPKYDKDCSAVCGNSVVEGSEECENADLSGCTSPPHGTCDEITCSASCSCEYNLKCDGSTCAVGSTDYNNYCVAPAYFECHVDTSCASGETEIIDLSAKNNAHAEIVGASGGYSQKLCCSNISSVQTTTGTGDCNTLGAGFTGLVTLSRDTNAHVEKYSYTGTDGFPHKKNICVELTSGSLDCIYDTKANCNNWGYNKYVVSISGSTNAHVGDQDAYSMVRCCKEIS